MNTKYEFVPGDEKTIVPGRTVKRIRAIMEITAFGVMLGDLGGYLESETCLLETGNAWVYGNAQVSNRNSCVWFSNVGRESGTLTVFPNVDGDILLTRGCFLGTIDEFLAASEKVHDAKTQHEYRLMIGRLFAHHPFPFCSEVRGS